jgi:hypothetical protein
MKNGQQGSPQRAMTFRIYNKIKHLEMKSQREARIENLAGWEARTRPLAGPLSPRGPQPTEAILGGVSS